MGIALEVIECLMDNSTFVMKHECEDFNTLSQLVVRETQEAVFFKNGQALDTFGPGRHTLKTQNIPLLSKLINLPTAGKTPFKCEVYFVNKTEQMAIKWGTDSQVEYIEPQYNFPIRIGASGDMSLRVDNSRKLLIKLVGTERDLSRDRLVSFFRGIMMKEVKQYLAQIMKEQKISIFEVDEHLTDLSSALKDLLHDHFLDYGLSLERFVVSTIVKPDNDPIYIRFKNLFVEQGIGIQEERINQTKELIREETNSRKIIMESAAIAEKRRQEGYTYQQERGYDVAEKVAQNEGVGNFSNMGVGLGMMGGMAGGMGAAVAGITAQALNPISGSFNTTDPSFGMNNAVPPALELKDDQPPQSVPQASPSDTVNNIRQRIDALEMLKGKIPEEMYNAKLQEIMNSI